MIGVFVVVVSLVIEGASIGALVGGVDGSLECLLVHELD